MAGQSKFDVSTHSKPQFQVSQAHIFIPGASHFNIPKFQY